jgi:hypothetical protein
MGEEVRSDFALFIRIFHKILGHLEREWNEARTMEMCREVVEMAMFLVTAYCLALRGEEVVKMDIAGGLTYYEAGPSDSRHASTRTGTLQLSCNGIILNDFRIKNAHPN